MINAELPNRAAQIAGSWSAERRLGSWSLRSVSWARSLPLGVTLLTVASIALREVADPDVWWHLATGRYIALQRHIPAVDVFSFTATGHRWVTHEWLADLLFFAGYRLFGFGGLMVLFALLIAAAFALVYLRCRTAPLLAAASTLLAALASSMTWGARPQMLSLFFASLYLYILERVCEGSASPWLLPPLTLLWANLHSGFVAGLLIIAAFVVGRELTWLRHRPHPSPWLSPLVRKLAWVGLASLVCSLLTPNGVSAALFPFGTLSNHLIQANIQEWFSPDFHAPMFWPLAAYWLALMATLAASRCRIDATNLLLLLGSAAGALYSGRHAPFLALVGAPLLAQQAQDLWTPQREGSALGLSAAPAAGTMGPARATAMRLLLATLGLALAALIVAIGFRTRAVVQRSMDMERLQYPTAAVAYMREHNLGKRIFNAYQWGGYLIWRGYSVFIDGRTEVYGDEVFGEYLQTSTVQPDWEVPLAHYGVDSVLIETNSPLAVVLTESSCWRVVYRDDLASLFVPAAQAAQVLSQARAGGDIVPGEPGGR